MGRNLSKDRKAVRESLRMIEGEHLRVIPLDELADMAGVDPRLVADFVRHDLWSGMRSLPGIMLEFDQDGRPAEDILDSAVTRSPYPMWCNVSREFRESMFAHLTLKRLKVLVGKFALKQAAERSHKRELISALSKASPALSAEFKEPMKALGPGGT